jgi:hypothetical protein
MIKIDLSLIFLQRKLGDMKLITENCLQSKLYQNINIVVSTRSERMTIGNERELSYNESKQAC